MGCLLCLRPIEQAVTTGLGKPSRYWPNEATALARTAARGGVISAAGSWLRFVIQFGTTIFLARILGPGEYGIATVVIVVASLSGLLRDSGLSAFIVQRRRLSLRIISGLHILSTAFGLFLAVLTIFLGPLTEELFHDSRYTGFFIVISATFFFGGLSAVPTALLSRDMKYRALAVIDVVSVAVACAAGVGVALAGLGAWSLVAQATTLVTVQAACAAAACTFKGQRPAGLRELRRVCSFSASVSVVQLLNYAAGNLDKLIVVTIFGPRAAGLYTQAFQLLIIPLTQICQPMQRVFVPTMSRLTEAPSQFKNFFRATISVVTFTLWPVFAALFVFADSVVAIVFGPAWADSSPIFRSLVWVGFSQSLIYILTWTFVATGQVRRQAMWTFVSQPVLILAFCVGTTWGVLGMVRSYAVASGLILLPAFLVVCRKLPLTLRDLSTPALLPVVTTVAALFFSYTTHALFPPQNNLTVLVGDLSISVVATVAVAWVVAPIRRRVLQILSQLR